MPQKKSMTFTWESVLVGGAAGAIGSSILNFFFDDLKGKRSNRRLLKKVFLERKLQAAENAIANWQMMHEQISSLIYFFDMMQIDEIDTLDVDFLGTNIKEHSMLIEKKIGEMRGESYKILTYFDFNDEIPANHSINQKIMLYLGKISQLTKEAENHRELMKQKIGHSYPFFESSKQKFEELKLEVIKQTGEMNDLYRAVNEYLVVCILTVREHLEDEIENS